MRQRKPQSTTAKHCQVVLFDLDGTLAHSMGEGLKTANNLRHLFGYEKLHEEDERLRRISGKALVREVLGLGPIRGMLWGIMIKSMAPFNARKIRLFEGIASLLAKLREEIPIGVLSSAPRFYVQTILRNGQIPPLEWEICGIQYYGKARALRRFLRAEKLLPHELLYIGDEIRDLTACREVGIPFIAVSWGKDHPDLFRDEEATWIAESPQELFAIIRRQILVSAT